MGIQQITAALLPYCFSRPLQGAPCRSEPTKKDCVTYCYSYGIWVERLQHSEENYSAMVKIFREAERLQGNLQGRLGYLYSPLRNDIFAQPGQQVTSHMRLIRWELQLDNSLALALAVTNEGLEHRVSAQTCKAQGVAVAWTSISRQSLTAHPPLASS